MEPSRSPTTSPQQSVGGRFPGNHARRCIIACWPRRIAGTARCHRTLPCGVFAAWARARSLPVLVHGAFFRAAKALAFALRPLDPNESCRGTVIAAVYRAGYEQAGTRTGSDASKGRNWCARQGTGRQASCGAVTDAGFGTMSSCTARSFDSIAFFVASRVGPRPPAGVGRAHQISAFRRGESWGG